MPNGRAADMFSLGCLLLELFILNKEGSLERIRTHRKKNPAYHANLDMLDTWLPLKDDTSPMEYYLTVEIRAMLLPNPSQRPMAREVVQRLTIWDNSGTSKSDDQSIFRSCCRASFIPEHTHQRRLELEYGSIIRQVRERQSALEMQLQERTSVRKGVMGVAEPSSLRTRITHFGVADSPESHHGVWLQVEDEDHRVSQ